MDITKDTPISELYHSEDELMHIAKKASPLKGVKKKNHKYIKREWKNKRWVYTYSEDLKNKKPVVKPALPVNKNVDSKQKETKITKIADIKSPLVESRSIVPTISISSGKSYAEKAVKVLSDKPISDVNSNTSKKAETETKNVNNESSTNTSEAAEETNLLETLSEGFENVMSWLGDRANDVVEGISETADDIGDAINKAMDDVAKKTADFIVDQTNKAAENVDALVSETRNAINGFFDDPDNMYDITSSSYKDKVSEILESDEWKNIVARGDPEYVKTNSDGSVTYLIDDYIVDKKHPILDVLGDIIAGRKVDVNEITADSTIAGLKDYAMGTLRSGILGATVLTTFLTEKFKLQQGTYDAQVAELMGLVSDGKAYVEDAVNTANTVIDISKEIINEDTVNLLIDAGKEIVKENASSTVAELVGLVSDTTTSIEDTINTVDSIVTTGKETVDMVNEFIESTNTQLDATAIRESAKRAASYLIEQAKNSDVAKEFDEGNVVQAAQMFMQSDLLKGILGDNEYYQMTEKILSGLSDKEIEALNYMLNQLRS